MNGSRTLTCCDLTHSSCSSSSWKLEGQCALKPLKKRNSNIEFPPSKPTESLMVDKSGRAKCQKWTVISSVCHATGLKPALCFIVNDDVHLAHMHRHYEVWIGVGQDLYDNILVCFQGPVHWHKWWNKLVMKKTKVYNNYDGLIINKQAVVMW